MRLEHAHWPLIAMLVLTQIAAGIFVCTAALACADADAFSRAQAPLAAVAFAFLNLGLAVSVLHLGRPLGAWRAFLGLRTSWMSREILAFSIFAGAAAAFTGAALWKTLTAMMPTLSFVEQFVAPLASVTAALGLLGVFCSAMIYVDTRRAFWSRELTFTKFFGTTLLLGTAASAAVLGWAGLRGEVVAVFAIVATVVRTALFGWEFQNLQRTLRDEGDANHRSALVMWKLRRPLLLARVGLFAGSTLFGLLTATGAGWSAALCATLAFVLTLGSQSIERYFFFTAVTAPRMPGALAP